MRLLQEKGLQFPRSEHLRHDVTAAYEFAVDVQLRNRRPIRVILDTLAQFFGLVDIVRSERNAEMVEYPDDLRRKSTSRRRRCALHEQKDLVCVHE